MRPLQAIACGGLFVLRGEIHMNAFKQIFKDQLTEKAKKKSEKEQNGYNSHLGWVFICNDFGRPKSVRTFKSLFAASKAYTYYTPNTFYRNDQRHAGSLRWLNAMVIDIDAKYGQNRGITFPDVMDYISSAGLPAPSLVVSTPSGGFHVYWYFHSPKRAFPKVIELYNRVQVSIAEAINADKQAVGAERWFRMPTTENTIYQSDRRVSFDDLCDWLSIYQEGRTEERKTVCVDSTDLLQHRAVKKLLEGVSEGQRDNTCYTLALAYKASGYSAKEAEDRLKEWNKRNDPPMRQLEIKRKVKSAYKQGSPAGPSAYWIRLLSGIPFSYQMWEEAKPREVRTYSHQEEWEEDVISYLKSKGGVISGSQRKIAQAIKSSLDKDKSIPYSTFKKIVERLVQIGIIIKRVEGKGRGAVTILTLAKRSKVVPIGRKKTTFGHKKNGFNSSTFIDQVVGGVPFISRDRSLEGIWSSCSRSFLACYLRGSP